MNQSSSLSPTTQEGKTSPSVAHIAPQQAQPFVGESPEHRQTMTDAEREAHSHIEHLQQLMTVAFIRYHMLGGFELAADYRLALKAWECALLSAVHGHEGH